MFPVRKLRRFWTRWPHLRLSKATSYRRLLELKQPILHDVAPPRLDPSPIDPIHPVMSQAADVTDAQWDAEVLQSDQPVLVDFWAEWCSPCKAMAPFVDRLAGEYQGRLKVVKVDTQNNPDVPARYGIVSIPTFLIIKGGEVMNSIVGSRPYDQLKAAVDPYL